MNMLNPIWVFAAQSSSTRPSDALCVIKAMFPWSGCTSKMEVLRPMLGLMMLPRLGPRILMP